MANFTFDQSFVGSIPIPDNDGTGITASLFVNPPPIPTGAVITGINIFNLNITHTYNADLDISLTNPDAVSIDLSSGNGDDADGYVNVAFSDTSPTTLPTSSAVITGTYHSEIPLAVLLGGTIAGNWSLKVVDHDNDDTGSLTSWGIRFLVNYSGTVTGTHGADVLNGSNQADRIYGHAGNDTIAAFAGNDWIWGGGGRDVMDGGSGTDRFVYESRADSGVTAATRDLIEHFAATDLISLRGIDANELTFGNQNFKFIGNQGFHHLAGELRYLKVNPAGTAHDITIAQADVDGDAVADFAIGLSGLHNLNSRDFIL
jgi:subtilisin-like proprotein convertase family protein